MRVFIREASYILGSVLVGMLLGSEPAVAGDIYGSIRLREFDTGKERPLARQVRMVVETTGQRIEAVSRKGGTYYMTVPEEGRFMLTLEYRGVELSAEIGSYYNPNRNDLIILHKDGQYRLRIESIREWHVRPEDKDQ